MVTIFVHRNGQTERAKSIDRSWLNPSSNVYLWVDLAAPSIPETLILSDTFAFHALSVEDARADLHYPKIEAYDGYLYVILHGISYGATGQPGFATSDIDFFVGPTFLVTVQDGHSRSIHELQENVERNPKIMAEGSFALFHRIVDSMVDHYRPEVEKLEDQIDELEKAVFEKPKSELIRQILHVKREISGLRRIITPQRDVIARLARRDFVDISTDLSFRFRDVYDHIVRIADDSVMFQDRITGILDAHLTNVSNRLNEVMKVLTVVSTIFMPLTLLSGLWGMNVALPHFGAGETAQFWWLFAIMVVIVAGMLALFRRKNWIVVVGKITKLPDDLANQIAAGEVVERPASVVKELVENSIDAGAHRLVIHIELGGKKQIRVEDDGEGMEPDDARLALERHATSKIRRADDLAAIRTLGFRGEALPSIASVSHFVLRTRARGTSSGTEIRVNGGLVASVAEAAASEGTTIEVSDLFYNLPARRKFLKADAAESAQVSRIVTQLALAYQEIGFTLTSGGRTVIECPPAHSLRDRLYQLYGDRSDLLEVHKEAGGIRLGGYVAALAEQGPVRGPQHVFINRRIIKDRTIAHAILDAYSVASIKERSPEVHLFLEMPPDALDVNVHPTKAEVRFREQSLVHEVVRRGLMETIGSGGVPQLQLRPEVEVRVPVTPAIPGVLSGGSYPNRWVPQAGGGASWLNAGSVGGFPQERSAAVGGSGFGPVPPASSDLSAVIRSAAEATAATTVSDIRPMIPLGQFRDTFIIAIDDEGVAIIDQHVAHERVLFERVMQRLTAGDLESQRLLVPLLLEVDAAAHHALTSRAGELVRFGYEVEPFGETTVKVSAVPALLSAEESATALKALAEDLEGLDRGAHVQIALQRIAATTACHAAVKANYPLTYEKMQHILEELRATSYSTICPHGRPVMLRLTRREIEKNFDRI